MSGFTGLSKQEDSPPPSFFIFASVTKIVPNKELCIYKQHNIFHSWTTQCSFWISFWMNQNFCMSWMNDSVAPLMPQLIVLLLV